MTLLKMLDPVYPSTCAAERKDVNFLEQALPDTCQMQRGVQGWGGVAFIFWPAPPPSSTWEGLIAFELHCLKYFLFPPRNLENILDSAQNMANGDHARWMGGI